MTSRVQKGSTVFRPVAKSRRPVPGPSRQASLAVEGSITLPTTESLPPSQLSSSLVSTSEDQNVTAITPTIPNIPDNEVAPPEHVEPISEPRPTASRTPTVPTIIALPSKDASRSRSVVPMVIATPRNTQTPKPNPPRSTSQGTATNSLSSLEVGTIPVETTQPSTIMAPSTSATLLPSTNETGATASQPPLALTDSNSVTPIPSNEEPPTKAPRKRKTPARSTKASKKRAESGDAEDTENVQEGPSTKKPRSRASSRASSSTPRPRRRAPSPPAYDPDADPGEDLDPTSVTMAELCSDTGQGRVSRKAAEILSNHAAWKAKNREKRARMRQIMEAKKYGREDELEKEDGEEQTETQTPISEAGPSSATIIDESGNGFDYSQDLATSRFNVQVRIGPNGETVIDEESLVVDRAENDGTENYTHVIESDQTKFVNSGSYGKKYRGSRWSAEETELFYDALSQYGENYELIAYVLPGRDRKSCKNKFKVEDKRNPARINHCLNNSIPVDMKTLSRMTGKDFSGPVPEIRVPTPMPMPPPPTEDSIPTETTSPQAKKRSRSRSRGVADAGVVVLGDVETFES